MRVDSGASAESEFDALDPAEQAELERALAELEAEENRQLSGKR